MKYPCLLFLAATAMVFNQADGSEVSSSPVWKLVWNDEFNGSEIDRQKWGYDTGNGFKADAGTWVSGWGNNELEFYTTRPTNAFVNDGRLHIRALHESFGNCRYTSARLVTRGHFDKCYGRIEFRAKLPAGQGLWPAFWLLPTENLYGPWAASGEIDVMEARGQNPSKVLGTIHYGSRWPANDHAGGEYQFPAGSDITDYHVYAVEWETNAIRWYVDSQLYSTQTNWWSCSKVNDRQQGVRPQNEGERNPWPAPFDRSFYLIINLAVGGNFVGGAPAADTRFPAELLVDYVRVYDKPPK